MRTNIDYMSDIRDRGQGHLWARLGGNIIDHRNGGFNVRDRLYNLRNRLWFRRSLWRFSQGFLPPVRVPPKTPNQEK